MNRREFLKTVVVTLGAFWLGLLEPARQMITATVTSPDARISVWRWPIEVITGRGEVWHTHNALDDYPLWERGAHPSLYFVNRRLAGPLASYIGGR